MQKPLKIGVGERLLIVKTILTIIEHAHKQDCLERGAFITQEFRSETNVILIENLTMNKKILFYTLILLAIIGSIGRSGSVEAVTCGGKKKLECNLSILRCFWNEAHFACYPKKNAVSLR